MPNRKSHPRQRIERWPFDRIDGIQLDPLFSPSDAARLIGLDERQLWMLVRDGDFDPPVERIPGLPGFHQSSISKWLRNRPTYRARSHPRSGKGSTP